jgi:hypothetical protein
VRIVPSRLPLVPVVTGLAVIASACSSPTNSLASSVTTTKTKTTTNTGLCTYVPPSVVATALEESMNYPKTLTHGATTECAYSGVRANDAAVIIRYDTGINASSFVKYRTLFERRGQKLGPITGLGDQAYYFSDDTGRATITTVVLLNGSLQILVTGTATLDQIGSIARFTLAAYEARHPASLSSP